MQAYRPEAMVRLAQALAALRGIETTVHLSPVNGAQREALRAAGREGDLARFRAEAARVAGEAGARFLNLADGHPFPDFDPAAGSGAAWLDGLHFKPVVGRWILALAARCAAK